MSAFIVFCFLFTSDSGTAVYQQAQRNKKEACAPTVTVTVIKGIPCAHQLFSILCSQNLKGRDWDRSVI